MSVSEICDKENEVEFLSDKGIITNLSTTKVILATRSCKNIYVVDFSSAEGDNLTPLRSQDESANLWHRRLGHVSTSLLNKLTARDLVHGLANIKFNESKVYDVYVKGKQTKTSFKSKKELCTSRELELIHVDLCGPVKIQSRGGKKYIFFASG